MAAFQESNGSFRVLFRHHGKVAKGEPDVTLGGVEETLLRLRQGFLKLPPGAHVVEFVQHKGTLPVTKAGAVVRV